MGANNSVIYIPPGGGTPSLTSTCIGYGDSSNQLTGSIDFTYDPVITNKFRVGFAGQSYFILNESEMAVPAAYITLGEPVGGNGTKIGIDDISRLITITNVPTYASDALAIAGGLTTGNLYKSTLAGITTLHIVP